MKQVRKLNDEPELGIVARIHIDVVIEPGNPEPFLSIANYDKLSLLEVIDVLAEAIRSMVALVGGIADPANPNFEG